MALAPGARLGPYEIATPLGTGGIGEVYRARDTKLDRDVAIKVLRGDLASDPERLKRFEQEARSASALNHPNIITIHDIGEQDGTCYIAMEYVEGVTLHEMLANGPLPNDKLFRYAAQMVEGLAKAHDAGLVHRDLKPDNIIISHDDYVKILDFGLVKLMPSLVGSEMKTMDRMTRNGVIVGTVPYMSPEQAADHNVDYRSDQFALGSILYEMATGKRAFARETAAQTLAAIIEAEPESVRAVNAEVPLTIAKVIDRCLAKDASKRYSSTLDIIEDLRSQDRSTPARTMWRARATFRVLGVLAIGIAMISALFVSDVLERRPGDTDVPKIESIVVLPLQNLSGNPEQKYFVDGMHEALTTELAKIRALKVISRTSAMQYEGVKKPMAQIARELSVDGLIEGSVAREGEQVRITVQLINGATDQHVWAESFDRELRGILALQSEVARAIATQIRVQLTREDETRLASTRSVHPAAYEAYLKGQYQWNKLNRDGWEAAVDAFQESIEIDPTYAPAYAMMSCAYSFLGYYSPAISPDVWHRRALDAAERAVSLDETLAEAHASLAFVKTAFDWDWAAADQSSGEAIRLNPTSTMALYSRAFFLFTMGRHEEAVEAAKRAVDLDPVAPHVNTWLGMFYFMARRYDEAIEQLNGVLVLEPDYYDAHVWLSYSYAKKGLFEDAAAASISLGRPWLDAWILALSGRSAEAHKRLEQYNEETATPTEAYFLAVPYGELGDHDLAVALLERSYQGRSALLSVVKVDPRIDALRDDPRFQDLLRRMSFPP